MHDQVFPFPTFRYSLQIFGSNFIPGSDAHICEPTSPTTPSVDITMATSQSIQLDEPSYPSYRELQSDSVHVIVSPEVTQRLFWPFESVFPTCTSIMKTPHSLDSLEPYFQPDTSGSSTGTWHEISQLPLTEPRISSIKVSVDDLDLWEEMWLEQHRGHTGPSAKYVTYGDLSDNERAYPTEMKEDGSWESDSDTEYLVRCCDEDRPPNSENAVTLVVKPSADNGFVIVHDYIRGKSS